MNKLFWAGIFLLMFLITLQGALAASINVTTLKCPGKAYVVDGCVVKCLECAQGFKVSDGKCVPEAKSLNSWESWEGWVDEQGARITPNNPSIGIGITQLILVAAVVYSILFLVGKAESFWRHKK